MKLEEIAPFYEFGPFRLDTTKCVLLRDGEVVPLSLKVFEILQILVEHRGQLMEKDDLMRRVWPNTVVEENNLARSISALRKALAELPNEHRYILTVPGRGYRFVASARAIYIAGEEVREIRGNGIHEDRRDPPHPAPSDNSVVEGASSANGEAIMANAAAPTGRFLSRRFVTVTTLALVILALGLAALFAFSASRGGHPALPRRLWQLTFDPGLQSEPTWSPDGRMLAYSSDRGGDFDIWVQPVGEGNPVRVTTSPAHDWQPDWAPEGNRIAFRSERDGGGLYVVPVLGGNERRVSSFGYRPRWSPDGTQILFRSILKTVLEVPKFYVVGLDGEPPREVLADILPEFAPLRVAWHPDGRRFSMWGRHRQLGWSFWTVNINDGAAVRSELAEKVDDQLKEARVGFIDFQWAPSGESLYFEGISQGVRNLWRIDVDPKTLRWLGGPERLTTGTGLDADMAISRDGKRMAFTSRAERTRLCSLPFDCVAGQVKGAAEPITAAGVEALYPELSPDGEKLVYLVQRADKRELRAKSLKDGRETLLMAADDFSRAAPHWSRDGRCLTYFRSAPARTERAQADKGIFLLPTGTSAPEERSAEEQMLTPVGTTPWDFSADGKWVLAGSDRQPPGCRSICLFPIAAAPNAEAQMRVVTSDPERNLYQARFSPDDHWISFCAAKARDAGTCTIYVVPASGGERRQITEGKYFDDKPRWSPDGRTLFFVSNRTGFFNVWGIRFDPSAGQPVGEPFRITAFQSPSQMIMPDVGVMEMTLAADRLILPIMEVSGGIWILDNLGR